MFVPRKIDGTIGRARRVPLDSEFKPTGPSIASCFGVIADADEIVMRLRVDFLRSAVVQLRELAVCGDMEDALNGSIELRRYFEWIKKDLSPDARGALFEQIQTLPKTE
jgi:hypothetical protein